MDVVIDGVIMVPDAMVMEEVRVIVTVLGNRRLKIT